MLDDICAHCQFNFFFFCVICFRRENNKKKKTKSIKNQFDTHHTASHIWYTKKNCCFSIFQFWVQPERKSDLHFSRRTTMSKKRIPISNCSSTNSSPTMIRMPKTCRRHRLRIQKWCEPKSWSPTRSGCAFKLSRFVHGDWHQCLAPTATDLG